MKKILSIMTMALLAMSVMPMILGAGSSFNIGGDIDVEEFPPMVFQCGQRVLLDDSMGWQPWRITGPTQECEDDDNECYLTQRLYERTQNYLFTGEKFSVDILVFDKNKIDDIIADLDVEGVEFNCQPTSFDSEQFDDCNARIDEEDLQYEAYQSGATMQAFTCAMEVDDDMYGPSEIIAKAYQVGEDPEESEDALFQEVGIFFLNPDLSLNVDGSLDFSGVRPGTTKYSNMLLTNDAEGGVILDLFIAGRDWQAVDGARCYDPRTDNLENHLALDAFRYYVENGAYDTRGDEEDDSGYSSIIRNVDNEGYVNINYLLNDGFEEDMFNDAEIIQVGPLGPNALLGYGANQLVAGGSGMSVTFKLDLPEPCYGSFRAPSSGGLFFYGEAI